MDVLHTIFTIVICLALVGIAYELANAYLIKRSFRQGRPLTSSSCDCQFKDKYITTQSGMKVNTCHACEAQATVTPSMRSTGDHRGSVRKSKEKPSEGATEAIVDEED